MATWFKVTCTKATDFQRGHIGLSAKKEMPNCDIMIQLSKNTIRDAKFIHLNALFSVLGSDPDLAMIPEDQRAQVLQTTYVYTGSDYTSFFQRIGKISFLATLFQYASFITGKEMPG